MTLTRRTFIASAAVASCAATVATRAAAFEYVRTSASTAGGGRGSLAHDTPRAASVATTAGNQASAPPSATPAPSLYVYHGAPLIAVEPARVAELSSWGAALASSPKPAGIVALTPHVRSMDAVELGFTGAGNALASYPDRFRAQLSSLTYESPPSTALASLVDEALRAARVNVKRGDARGQNHTVWAPLLHLFPAHDVPVLELSLPFFDERGFFALGRALAPLRSRGVLVLASGTATHNLAGIDIAGTSAPKSYAVEFDAWLKATVDASDIDALLDWRHKAPGANLAHPDDGGHFRVLLVTAGAALGDKSRFDRVRFPVEGFEYGSFSTRGIQIDSF